MKFIQLLCIGLLFISWNASSQKRNKKSTEPTLVVQDSTFHGLKWRNIGPFRGGRSVTSTGVIGQPMTYYMGTTGGGIWKTTDDGITWKNCSDTFIKTGTVGDLAVSEQDPNLVIAGMGEHAARGVMTSMGDGVYKSTDAGKSWKHMGLDNTRHISDVIIHPTRPDIIYVAAQGAQYGPSEERGIYRSLNGGQSWEKILFVNNTTGASSLSMDMKNPLILYASMWEHRRFPWTIESGGPHSGLYKSTDGGDTWEKLKEGLPEAFGKSGISVSRANPERVYAVIEAEGEKGGVYRSDDAGKKWTLINKERINISRSWYYMEIFADPQDENVVYVLNAPMTRSIDGGKSFQPLAVPHGDNHDLWIHPFDNDIMINSNDGGANISNNGGASWSTQENQPTTQFYRVITDHEVPYNIYAGQQDNSSIAIASRTNKQGIDWKDWYSVAGCESAYLAFDPDHPETVYGGCYQGIIERWDRTTRETKQLKQYPELALGNAPENFKYRFNWNAPIISSPHNRKVIYHAGNVVFKTSDGGIHWEVISPDLTRNDKTHQGPGGGPYTNEAAGGENYNTLMYLVESPHEEGVLWAGSDDGLIHLTRDGGENWDNVTPPDLEEGIVNSIEVSPHDPATAYAVVMRYKFMDLQSYIYRTGDYGKTWTRIVNGIDGSQTFARAVREDPVRKGLLYAGTETGLYISFDQGQNWQSFQLNLPLVPINDLIIHDNDLVVATAGRSFWILDDLGVLQQGLSPKQPVALYKPKDTYRLFGGRPDEPVTGLGENPSEGITMDYYLDKDADSLDLKLQVLSNGKLLRTYTNKVEKDFKSWPGGPGKPKALPSKKGYNRFTWDFRKESIPPVKNVFVYGNYDGSRVGPGTYQLRMTLDGITSESEVTLLPNPSFDATPEAYKQQMEVLDRIESTLSNIHEAVTEMRSAKTQLENYANLLKNREKADSLLSKGKSLITRIDTWEKKLIQPQQKTFQDVINHNNQLNAELMNLKEYVDSAMPTVTEGASKRLTDLLEVWEGFRKERDAIVDTEMLAYNALFKEMGIQAIILQE